MLVDLADDVNMSVQIEHIDILGHDGNIECGGLQHGGLSDQIELVDILVVGNDPAQAQTGSEDLGEGAEISRNKRRSVLCKRN